MRRRGRTRKWGDFLKKTANVQLNQWESTDRILRTDFNADNEKIDAAIGGMQAAMRVVKLLDVTTELAATQIDLDVSGIDLTAYQELWLYLRYGIDTEVGYIQMRLNGINEGYTSSSSSYSHCYSVNLDNQRGIKKITMELGTGVYVEYLAPVAPSAMQTINLLGFTKAGYNIAANFSVGTNLQICGVRR